MDSESILTILNHDHELVQEDNDKKVDPTWKVKAP